MTTRIIRRNQTGVAEFLVCNGFHATDGINSANPVRDVRMVSTLQPIAFLSTMGWVYAAASLVFILFLLLVTPYFGVYGERNIDTDTVESDTRDGESEPDADVQEAP